MRNLPCTPAIVGSGLLVAILAASGCDAVLTTSQLPAVREDGMLGAWKDMGRPGTPPDPEPVLFKYVDGEYWLGSANQFTKGEASPFTLARVGKVLIAQSPGKTQCDDFVSQKGKPCWSLNRLELLKDHMSWYDFDSARMAKDSFSGTLNVAHSLHRQRKENGNFENALLISAEIPQLQTFLETYVKRSKVFRLTGRLERMH